MAAPTFAVSEARATAACPLCVDLDGTLVRTDLLFESIAALARQSWWRLLLVPFWMLRGRAYLKGRLAHHVSLAVASLPYREKLLAWLRSEKAGGRIIVLATGSHVTLAQAVAAHLGLFDEVIGTEAGANLTGGTKAAELVARFGAKGFDYVGDSPADEAVWAAARMRIGAGTICRGGGFDRMFPEEEPRSWKSMVRALRPKHWVKNLLVFVPAITSHELFRIPVVTRYLPAFAAFSLVASAIYIINDLMDLDADRRHPVKRHRPFASGELSIQSGLLAAPVLLAAGLGVCATLGAGPVAILAIYFVLTSLYSFYLKRKLLVDVFALAILYTLRIVEGAAATGIHCSVWLLAFSLFTFLSLAFLKRSAELTRQAKEAQGATAGRGYFTWDVVQVNGFGVAAGFVSSLVLGLYIGSEQVRTLYRQPEWLWLLVPLDLYWLCRVWILSHRGAMNEDPIVFAAGDRVTWASSAITMLVLACAVFSSFSIPGVSR